MKNLRYFSILLFVLVLFGCDEWDKRFGAVSQVEVVSSGSKFSIRNSAKSDRVKVTFSCYNKGRAYLAKEVIDPGASIYPLVADYQDSGSAADVDDKSGFRASQDSLFKAKQEYDRSSSSLNEREKRVFELASFELKRANDLAIKNLESRITENLRRLSNAENETRELSLVYDNVRNPYGVDISRDIAAQTGRSNSRASNAASSIRSMRDEIEQLRSQALDPLDYIDPLSPERVKAEKNLNAVVLSVEKYEDDFCDLIEIHNVVYAIVERKDASISAYESEAITIEATAVDFANEYDKNTVAADIKFKEKRFKVRGVVAEISTDMFNNVVITMESGDEFGFNNPHLTLKESEKMKAAELSTGQNAAMICVGAGDVAKTPMAKDCIFE